MENSNIESFQPLINPKTLKLVYPRSKKVETLVKNTREEISKILSGNSNKKLFIVGPCSIHNVEEAYSYARNLKILLNEVKDKILIVMRVYFEKPRTTIGWKGLINDPDLNNTFQVNKGLAMARKLLMDINELGVPCGYEVLDTITPQYIADLMSWGAIGARTTESQVHRQMVSGLSMPVGFKNGTSGDMVVARDAVMSAAYPHCFMGITDEGVPAICNTRGNPYCHVILRGGKNGPNYSYENIKKMENLLREKEIKPAIMIDCSHGNSNKNFKNQKNVLGETINSMQDNKNVIGVMIESNIIEGKQTLDPHNVDELKYGISITDSCISIQETFDLISNVVYTRL
jgi:3-deoxy-7-phosphoheptulonate synthase